MEGRKEEGRDKGRSVFFSFKRTSRQRGLQAPFACLVYTHTHTHAHIHTLSHTRSHSVLSTCESSLPCPVLSSMASEITGFLKMLKS